MCAAIDATMGTRAPELGGFLERKACSVTVVLPAREAAKTIGRTVTELEALRELGAIDKVLVVDAASTDGTAKIAAAAGATIVQESELVPELRPVMGKGDAMWRSQAELDTDLVCFADADSSNFDRAFALKMLDPLIDGRRSVVVKGAFRRPLRIGSVDLPDEGGRVTELCARPLLAAFFPPLAELAQPLAGEMALPLALMRELPFSTGYAVESGLLVDLFREHPDVEIVEADLTIRHNAHQPLAQLGDMATEVAWAIISRAPNTPELRRATERLARRAKAQRGIELTTRPPWAAHRAGDGG